MNEAQATGLEGVADGHPAWKWVYEKVTNLIIVLGHAIFVGHEQTHATRIEYWKGAFQAGYRGNDEARLYAGHVRSGIESLATDPKAMLLFSGGQTREEVGPYSEAQGYWYLAEACDWFGFLQCRERALTEEYARDSFENLLFSIHRFRQCTRRLPSAILVCGFAFKAERYTMHFDTLKQQAVVLGLIGITNSTFSYKAVNDPPYYRLHGLLGGTGSLKGESDTRNDFDACPLGNVGKLLSKRITRDPYRRGNPYS